MSKQKAVPPPANKILLAEPRTYSNAHTETIAAMLHLPPIGEYDAWHNYAPKKSEKSAISDADVGRILAIPDGVLMEHFERGQKDARKMKVEVTQ